jgi:hypothetical protein
MHTTGVGGIKPMKTRKEMKTAVRTEKSNPSRK